MKKKEYAMKEVRILIVIALMNAAAGYAMDAQKGVAVANVDRWDAIEKTKKDEMRRQLTNWAIKYNANAKATGATQLSREQVREVVKMSYKDIKSHVRLDAGELPQTDRQYYDNYLTGNIRLVLHPELRCPPLPGLTIQQVSDSEDEHTDYVGDSEDEFISIADDKRE